MSDFTPILTAAELAKHLKVSERTVLDLARRGKIPHRRIGNRWRFLLCEVMDHLFIPAGGDDPSRRGNKKSRPQRFVADMSKIIWED